MRRTAIITLTAALLPVAASAQVRVKDVATLQGVQSTPLRGPDGSVYALAQGALSIGGFGGGKEGNSVQVNPLTVGRVPAGGMVSQAPTLSMPESDRILLSLKEAD